jgi:hypothetical protein
MTRKISNIYKNLNTKHALLMYLRDDELSTIRKIRLCRRLLRENEVYGHLTSQAWALASLYANILSRR